MATYLFETAHCGIVEHELKDQKSKEIVTSVPKIVLLDGHTQDSVDWSEAASLANWLADNVQFDARVKRTVSPFYCVSEGAFRLTSLGLDPRRIPTGFDTKSFRADYKAAKDAGTLEEFKTANVDDYVNFSASELRRKSKGSVDLGLITAEQVEALVSDNEAEIRGKYGDSDK